MKKRLLLMTILFAPFIYGQTACPFDQTVFSGTVTVSGIGASETKASDASNNHRFGERVAIDGDIAAVVSRSNGAAAGKVYVFINDGSGNWTEQTILTASDGFAGDNFGSDIALEGNYLLVGARSQLDESGVDTGAAYLFEYNGVDTWTEVSIFEPSDGVTGHRFGESVDIEGDIIIVGARNGCTGGCAYVYENDGTNTFTYTETKLEPQVQSGYDGARFGNEVKIKDGRAYVGGPYDYSSVGKASAGSVQIWDQANDGSWSRTHRLRGTETSESFGWSMDVEGDYLAIGAMNFETGTTAEADQGRVFVYKADSNGDYLEANRVMIENDDKDSFTDQRFGTDVVLEDGYLYVGTWGDGTINGDAVYIFQDDGTNNWTQIAKITSGAGWDEFANRAVAVSFPTLLIGQNEADSPNNSGSVYFVSLANQIAPVASVTGTTQASPSQSNGGISLSFSDETTQTDIKFSIDGGATYPYVFDDTLGSADITNLAANTYDVWVAFDEESCPINLGNVTVNEIRYTAIPDTNFEAALESLGYDDISADGQVPTALIEVVTDLDINGQSISDLTGIEDFTALTDFNCENNSLISLDVSANTNLQTLKFDNNSIVNPVFGANTILESILGRYNQMNSFDVSQNTGLTTVNIRNNFLTSIDLSNNVNLQTITLIENTLTSIDLTNNVNLENAYLRNNGFTSIDLSQNILLEKISLDGIGLTSLDVSNNAALQVLRITDNSITTLDLSNNPALTDLECENNNLDYLNVQNGNNTSITTFLATGNPLLTCIIVDDVGYSTTNWTSIDGATSFSDTYCRYTQVPDANFEAALEALGYDDISADGQVPTALIEVVTSISTSFESITDFTGIEDFTALESLTVSYNSFTSLDVSNNTNLTFLNCGYSSLASLDVSKNLLLETLWISSSLVSSIDLSQNANFKDLVANGNSNLVELNINNGNNTNVSQFNTAGTSNLSCILVDDAGYSTTNWTNIDDVNNFSNTYCRYTAIPDANFEAWLEGQGYDDISNDGQVPTEIIEQVTGIQLTDNSISDLKGLEDFIALEVIDLNGTSVSTIDFEGFSLLEEVYLDNNPFTNIDLSNNTNLTSVVIVSSPIEVIYLNNGFNTSITTMNLNVNTQLSCVVVDDRTYATNNWTNISDLNLYSETLCGYTEIPDLKFEERLEALGYDDISGDGLIPTATIETVTELDVRGQQITDLTGIAAFVALKELRANNNLIFASPDFSANTALELLYIGENSFTDGLDLTANVNLKNLIIDELNIGSIDISANTQLIQFEAEDCGFTTIDLSNNTALTTLDLGGNSLTSIDVTTLVQLENLSLEDNQISAIDVSKNTALKTLYLDDNNLSTLDLSNNLVLESVQASRNSSLSSVNVTGLSSLKTLVFNSTDLSSIDVSTNTALDFFSVFGNQIETLDLSNNSVLSIVQVFDNVLTSIDLRNGNTEGIASINVSNNPDLDCISISNPIYATENFSTSVSFEALCGVYSYIPDDNFEAALGVLGLDDVANDNQIPTANIEPLTSLNISGEGIADLSGIAYFISLTTLDASFNNLDGTVDLSSNTLLETLNLEANGIQFLDFSSLPNLTSIKVDKNALLGLNIQNGSNTSLTSFNATENSSLNCILVDSASYATTNFTNIDDHTSFNETDCTQYISIPDANFEAELIALGLDTVTDGQVPYLNIYQTTVLNLEGKNISDLTGIEGFDALIELNIHDNNLSTIDLSKNILLQDLKCDDNNFTILDLSSNVNLVTIDIDDNPQLTTVNVTGCVLLEEMIADDSNLSTLDLSTNVNLKILDLDNNNFTTIDLTNNVLLEDIDLESNDIAVLDLTALVNLKDADLEDNVLTTIDLSKNILLESTDLDFNQFTSLDFTNNTALTRLDIDDNSLLTTVTFGAATNLQELYADDTAIATIDLSLLIGLTAVNLEDTNLRSLDVSKNINLVDLKVSNALLVSLDMRNGNNSNFTRFEATGNTNLECIIVDDVAYATTNWTNIDGTTSFSDTYCRYTAIPDTNFEAELEAQGYDDISGDGQVPTALIEGLATLDVSSKNISDLTGIEDFIALQDLDCEVNTIASLDLTNNTLLETIDCDRNDLSLLDFGNNTNLKTLICNNNTLLTSLDLSSNTGLETIQCVDNGLTSINLNGLTALKSLSLNSNSLTTLDLTTNTALEIFTCGDNTISSIDVTNNTSLTYLSVAENTLTSLDVSNNLDLVYLFCSDNNAMTELDVTNNTLLEWLYVQNNNLTTIDLSNNVLLEKLWLNDNQLTSLDVTNNIALTEFVCYSNSLSAIDVSNNTQLDWFYCDDNNLTELNLTTNTVLTSFNCSNNALTSLNLQNGNNTNLTFSVFTNNPDLNCILVDDAAYSTTNWTNIDGTTSFSDTYCNYTTIPDANFEAELEAQGYDDISGDGQVPTALIEVVTSLDLANKGITDLTGIEDFIGLTSLNVTDNILGTIDVSNNVNLETLDCQFAGLSALDVSSNIVLRDLYANGNTITSINLANNIVLRQLGMYDNDLTSIDLSTNTALVNIDFFGNELNNIDVSANVLLEDISLESNNITSLDLSTNTALENFNCNNNALVSLNIQNGANTNINNFNTTNNPDLYCILVDDAAYSATNWTNIDVQTSFNETSCNTVVIAPKVFLQGALLNPNTGEENWMRDDLRVDNGLYGATSPYGDGIRMSEAIGLDDAGSNSTIDWIWVELRDATDPTQVIAGQSAILQRDGDVVDVAEDRVTPLTFDVPVGDYYVVIKHRNHLGIMTAASISLSQTATSVDFTDGSVTTYGTNGQTTYGMPTGVSAMWAGDANGDGKINLIGTSNDSNEIRDTILNDPINLAIQFYGFNVTGYNDADVNLTGGTQIIGSDNDANLVRDNILNHPINTFIQFYGFSITEQLPENVSNTRIAMDIALLEKMKVLASKNK